MTRRGRQLDWNSQSATRGGGGGRAAVGRSVQLERQESQKSASVSVTGSSMPPTIQLDDDDDDVHISSPRSFAQARSAGRSSRHRSRTAESRAPADNHPLATDDLLELRLGPTNYNQSTSSIRVPVRQVELSKPRHRTGTFTIDLTNPSAAYDADCILVNEFVQKKRKPVQAAHEPAPEPVKELKLTCAICMDSMKEETSTTCGHIFCRGCIYGAIAAQEKCPTCREALSRKETHRIYISGSLRNP